MFDQLKNMVSGEIGGTDPSQLAAAAEQHLGSIPHGELVEHVQTAVQNMQQQDPDLANKLQGLVSEVQQNPADFKGAVLGFIQSNPQVLQHFAPDFTQGILSKVTGA